MKTKTIIFYIIGILVIGVIIFFLLKWRKKLETEKQELEAGTKPLVVPGKDITELTDIKITEAPDRSQLANLKP